MRPKPMMLMILDGWGIRPAGPGNAVCLAQTPHLDNLLSQYPHTQLQTSGKAVGLPDGIMGNSEVGHLNIGAGRTVYQELVRINRAIQTGEIKRNEVLLTLMQKVKAGNAALHLMGLVSDGGVHSHLDHLFSLLDMAKSQGVKKVYVHAILDGRDTAPDSGAGYLKAVQTYLASTRAAKPATICGRFFAMDRDNRWERTQKAFALYTQGQGEAETDPVAAVQKAYDRGETDEFVRPIVLTGGDGSPVGTVQDGDGIIFFNFRADRARQITRAFTETAFAPFPRSPLPSLCGYVCMTQYDEKFDLPVAFKPQHLDRILGEVVSEQGLGQLRIAETEKYAHVTYFFNGGEESPFPLEERCLVPSPREIPTYDLKPEMSAPAVTEQVLARVADRDYGLVVINFANMDMVGHTGVLDAAVKACETVDHCVGRIVAAVTEKHGSVLITADHGNAEMMTDDYGHVHTAHTLNPVPLVLVDDTLKTVRLKPGSLRDIAPTILKLMGIEKPCEMDGSSLF